MDLGFAFLWFNALVAVLLAFDLLVIHRRAENISIKEAFLWSLFWISAALLFGWFIYESRGFDASMQYLTGYLVEKSLSVDNLFIFLVIFEYFGIPGKNQYRILFLGILGAILLRGLFIFLGITLLNQFYWVMYLLGIFVILTGIKLGLEKEYRYDPEKNLVIRLMGSIFPVEKSIHGNRFFIRIKGILYATPLFIALLAIETTDVIFALDSIPAILAITQDPFIVYTSNIFAVLGLRSLYFCLSNLMNLFEYMRWGLALILILIGVKMVLADIIEIPTAYALLAVLVILILTSLFSYLATAKGKKN